MSCAVSGCQIVNNLLKVEGDSYLCSTHRAEIRALKKRLGKESVFADYLEAIAEGEKNDDQPVCDSCHKVVPKGTEPFADKQSGALLILCGSCKKLFKAGKQMPTNK